MSQRSRQTLAIDAEKLYAAHQLWVRHNELLQFVSYLSGGSPILTKMTSAGQSQRTLQRAVHHYMNAIGEGHHEDGIRAFLRTRVRDLGGLFPHVAELVRISGSDMTGKSAEVIPQANQIVLVRSRLICNDASITGL